MKHLIGPIAALPLLLAVAGCQSNSSTPQSINENAAQSASMRTPDGDQLNQPIPYPHYPYDIARGGGGGSTR